MTRHQAQRVSVWTGAEAKRVEAPRSFGIRTCTKAGGWAQDLLLALTAALFVLSSHFVACP